jgi:hypothetical protein
VRRRVRQVALDEDVDPVVERGREQQPLAHLRRAVHEALDAGQETEIGHVVGLVEDGDLHGAEVAVPLADEVLEPARAGDEHVDAAGEGLHLRVLADATEDRGGLHPDGAGQRVDDRGDLVGQLAGRHQDQRARPLGLPPAVRGSQAGDQREAEGQGLARAGAAATEDVPAGEAVGQRGDLDRERRGDAAAGEHLDQGRGDA